MEKDSNKNINPEPLEKSTIEPEKKLNTKLKNEPKVKLKNEPKVKSKNEPKIELKNESKNESKIELKNESKTKSKKESKLKISIDDLIDSKDEPKTKPLTVHLDLKVYKILESISSTKKVSKNSIVNKVLSYFLLE